MAENGVLLELRHIRQVYGQGPRSIVAVEGIDLAVHRGEFVALLGPSGCGKSTLLRIIAGLNVPTEGDVLYRGQPLHGVNPHTTIVFQTFALFPWLTVIENVEVALRARGMPLPDRRKRALALLDKVGLDGFENAYPRELSGGMRQKVGFARAMAVEPELLCLDEPFSALDVLSAESLRGELLELWTSGQIPTQAIVLVTHNIEEAVFLADRIVVMDTRPGRIAAEVSVDLPHPRQRKGPEFLAMVDRVYGAVAGQTQAPAVELGSAPGEPGKTRALPLATVSALAGLLEHLDEEAANREDLYQLADDLRMEIDDLLPVVEAGEILGFLQVDQGDACLTPLGETFAEASILARKEIFGTRLRRVPLIRWILKGLRAAPGQRVGRDFFQDILEWEFRPDEAEQQLDQAIDWGRYGELFGYDDDNDQLFLESQP
ncbi:MAG: ABC transporter ATP-binding protein [Anaerolineae bacterium]